MMAERIVLLGIDDTYVREGMTTVLQDKGYEVLSLSTPAEMYQWLATNGKPDRIICDNLSQLYSDKEYPQDGYGILIELSRDPRYNDIPFGIFGVGWDDSPEGRGLAKPELPPQLCFWILKPFTAEEFLDAIRNCDGATPYGQAPQEEWNLGSSWLSSSPWPSSPLYDEDEHTRNWDDFITKCYREMQAQVKFHPKTTKGWLSVLDLIPVLRPVIDYQTYRPRVEYRGIRLHLPNSRTVVRLDVLSHQEETLKLRLMRNDQAASPIYVSDKNELAPALLQLLQLPTRF